MEQYATTIRKLEEQRTSLNANLTHERAKNQRLAAALKGVMNSIEAHVYLKEPPTDPDEYDLMMQPLWEEARAALAGVKGETT